MSNKYHIYILTWEGTDWIYIGCTTNPKSRLSQHKSGWEWKSHPKMEVLFVTEDLAEAQRREIDLIARFSGRALNKLVLGHLGCGPAAIAPKKYKKLSDELRGRLLELCQRTKNRKSVGTTGMGQPKFRQGATGASWGVGKNPAAPRPRVTLAQARATIAEYKARRGLA